MDLHQLITFIGDSNNTEKLYPLIMNESKAICDLLKDPKDVLHLASVKLPVITLLAEKQPQLLADKFKDVSSFLSFAKVADYAAFHMINHHSSSVISLFKTPSELAELAICAKTASALLFVLENEKIKELFKSGEVLDELMQKCQEVNPVAYDVFLGIIEWVKWHNKNRQENTDSSD